MNSKNKQVAIALTFLWIGSVCSISFLEAWIKFRAPGVTLALGLSIGKLVFGALNKVEWAFAFIIGVILLVSKSFSFRGSQSLLAVVVILLLLQTVWLLPALNLRANLYKEGVVPGSSLIHIYYIAVELAKVLALLFFGKSLFKLKPKNISN